MVYIPIKMRLALAMAYIIIIMHLAPHVPFETLIMVYIFIKMQLALHVPIKTLAMAYVFVETCLTLVMAYVPFKMHLTLAMVNIFMKMHFAHNNILDVLLKHRPKSISTSVQLFLSPTPFCSGMYGAIVCFTMPFSL